MVAAQAIDLREPDPAPGTGAALEWIRSRVPFLDRDRDLSEDIAGATALVRDGSLIGRARSAVADLR